MPAQRRADPRLSRPANRLLTTLPAGEYDHLVSVLDEMEVRAKTVLLRRGRPASDVYFPASAAVSLVTMLEDGKSVEGAIVGSEGMVGVHIALDSPVALHDAVVEMAGTVWRLPASVFAPAMNEHTVFHRLVNRYLQSLMVQLCQSSACNRLHSVKQRTCRWLLSIQDRVQRSDLPVTQETLAMLLGVRRASITEVTRDLSLAGSLSHRPGYVTIADRQRLEAEACECYFVERDNVSAMFG